MICARSEVGLSRLPVTEEIAGSNPVERATDIFTLTGYFFMENIPYLLHFCTICVMISPIGLEGLRSFYNKISDNVRGRIPSVMVYNPNKPNSPSGSPEKSLPGKIIALVGAAAFALGAAGCNGETYTEPTPDTTTSTEQEVQSPTPETTTPPLLNPEQVRQEYREVLPQKPVDVDETADKLNRGEEPLETLTEFIKKQGFSFPHIDEKIPTIIHNCISVEKKDAADKLGSQVGSVIAVTSMLQNPEYGLDKTSVNTITDSMAETFVHEDYRQGFKDYMYHLGLSIESNLDNPKDFYPISVPGTQASAVLQAKASEEGCYGAWYHGKDLRNPYGTGAGDVQIDRYGFFGTNFYRTDGFNNDSGDIESNSVLKALVTHHKRGENVDNNHGNDANLGTGAWIIHMELSYKGFNYKEDGKETTIKTQDQ